MSAPSLRKETPAVADGRITFTIAVDAVEIVVHYRPHWMPGLGHFEFRSPHEPRRPIPISETGYRSYFAAMEDIEAVATPVDFACRVALGLRGSRAKTGAEDSDQLALF
jgi:hypothetical protein